MVAQSGGEVNRLLDRRLVECLPAADAAHGDLPRGHQGPEQHGRHFRVGQRALGLHPALELPVQAFDGVGSPQRLPLPRRIAHEGVTAEEEMAVLRATGSDLKPPLTLLVPSDSWWKLVFGVAPDHDGCSIRRRGQSAKGIGSRHTAAAVPRQNLVHQAARRKVLKHGCRTPLNALASEPTPTSPKPMSRLSPKSSTARLSIWLREQSYGNLGLLPNRSAKLPHEHGASNLG